ncbi:Centrosomal protein of 68 kDa [Oryzias melastigma]|uniref:Centrosomal protein of 68 kDa n=1 Tax=Oryzias melastigma TaxID=30732 RepID=A0A834CHP2_ORYME|nr:Centrosomal protein of 68 kDa [Oryzias melastigma]
MDGNGSSQQPKMQLPSESPDDRQKDTRQQRDKEEPHKSVSLAASSSYLMDRHYVVRKPLFSAEQHMSVLKTAHSHKATEKENHSSRSRDSDMSEAWIPDKCNLPRCDISAPPKTRDPSFFLSATGLQAQSCWEKSLSRSPFHDRKSAQSSLPSSFLHVQKVRFPLRPPLTSEVLSPTCSWSSKMCSPGAGEESPASPYQENYWACAIPKALPTFLNRNSADWNPNVEYEALLDYTYPLKPGHVNSDWDSTKQNQEFLLKTHTSLQDSGIELDQLCSSTSLSGQDFSLSDAGQSRERSTLSAGHRSPDPHLFPRFSDGSASSFMPSPTGSANVFVGALDCCTNEGEENTHTHNEINVSTASPGAFTRKVDDEFWPLPEQLGVSAHLSKQVRDLTAELSRPASWESTEQGTTSTLLSSVCLQNLGNFDEDSKRTKLKSRGQKMTFQTASGRREAVGSGNTLDRRVDSTGERRKESRLREAEDVVEELGGTVLPDCQTNSSVDQEDHHTLMKHIQRFQKELSSHQPLTSSVLHSGQHLLNCINATSPCQPQTRHLFSKYFNETLTLSLSTVFYVAVLRDTLLLIEKQSGVLQTQSDHLFSSIMSAVDSLTQPSPVTKKQENEPAISHKPTL